MAEEILSKVHNLKIADAENQSIAFDNAADDDNTPDIELSLVGKVLTMRAYNFEPLKRKMNQIWSISHGAFIRPIENELFVFQFTNHQDKAKVLVGTPWTFHQNLLLLNEIEGDAQPS